MKKITLIVLILLTAITVLAQEEEAIKKAALDYAETFYTGDFARLETVIHPDFNKASATVSSVSGDIVLTHFTYSQLLETTRLRKPEGEPQIPEIKIDLLKNDDNFANVKISTPDFFDFVLLVKIEGNWKIMNVASTDKIESTKYDEDEIYSRVEMYQEGILGGDAKRLELSILPGYSRGQRITDNSTGKSRIVRLGFESAVELSLNKTGTLEEIMRDYNIRILSANEKLATVELVMPFNMEYLQLFKARDGWKVFNAFRRGNPEYSFFQNSPVYLEKEMPDFTLPLYKGGEFTVSKNKGKNTMIIFLRGWIGQIWCPLCQYQYMELAELEKENNWREKYNLDVYFVLPYSEERIDDWFTSFKQSNDIINGWRNLEGFEDFSNFVNTQYPIKFELEEGEKVPMTFPILLDEDRKVSKRFKLFTTFWDGVKAEQNVSTIFILDENGVVQFKYFSQQTQDRPTYKYLMKYIESMN